MADRGPGDKPVKGKTRQDRLAEALRQNLRRRKAQQKGRRETPKAPSRENENSE